MSLSDAYGRSKPAGGFELQSWIFMRVSGVLLLLLALGHLAIMHLINSVHTIDYAFVVGRYDGWLWRSYDLLLLVLAMIHGTNGMRVIIDDFVHHPGWRRLALGSLYALTGGLLLLGTWTALFFRAGAGG